MASGDPVSYADAALAQRRIGTATGVDTDTASATLATETIIDTVTCNVVAGRTYRIRWVFQWNPVSASSVSLRNRIRVGNTSGSQITYNETTRSSTTPNDVYILEADWTAVVTGSQQFSGTSIRLAGTVNSQFRGASSQLRSFIVEFAYV